MTAQRPPRKSAWKKGQSGNPAGRKKGSINVATRLRTMIDAEAIVRMLELKALEGDVQAARTLLERALPVYRSTASPVELSAMESAETLSDKAHAVLAAVASGELPPDLGASLVTAIGNVTRVVEVDELLRRIEALEKHREEAR
ncbi:DUF5681 domain-containing protein [Rhodanobacter sp. Si-c]|uniref:DUF5681 domain-containing protein n=1 Tax=Rhodanobacter lycopersici TaxID=3162487 RepID=A0ABV3Q9Y7_9GAMM